MSWRGDIAMGKYGKLPCALIDNNMFPSVEVDCGSFVVTCPCCGSQIPCLDIRFIDARDRLSDEVRNRQAFICRCIRRNALFVASISCMTPATRDR